MRAPLVLAALAASLFAHPAAAQEAPVATARPDAPLSAADQIDAYLKSSPVLETERQDAVAGVVGHDDGKIHGEVAVGVGTGGYRSVYARTDMPLGANGRLALAFEDTRFDGRGAYAPGGIDGFGPGPFFGADRQRCGLQSMTPPRPLDAMTGMPGDCGRARR